MTEADKDAIEELSRELGKCLAGKGPVAQGFSLAEMVAMFLASHADLDYRNWLLDLHVKTVRDLIPDCEKRIADAMLKNAVKH